ncbi:MAG: acetate/propionate family kinase [Abditibacteriales bacterium]|nr:acetate/propionate family kinase [Abditibacteriales bacterium]MDW8367173.1 acetate/propionate family kinase [Abditibacteriales bacterium]
MVEEPISHQPSAAKYQPLKILICNIGSTSLKYQLFSMPDETVLAKGRVERIGSQRSPLQHWTVNGAVEREVPVPTYKDAVQTALSLLTDAQLGCLGRLDELSGVGFKTVHAGDVRGAVRLTEDVLAKMEEYTPVVPAHNPPYLRAIRIFQELLPHVPLVGVFEPHFHVTMPEYAAIYGIPYEWTTRFGIRRYGFHGASHHYVAERVPQRLGVPPASLKIISCHLGGSSSICAIDGGKSVDTSMGFSAQSGLFMARRAGDFDLFAIPFLQSKGLTLGEIFDALSRNGGLLGVSGVSEDMRDLEEAAAQGNARAQLAIDAFVYGVKKYIGSYVAALNGVDVLAFTGGMGERGVNIRARICRDLDYLGIRLDDARNAACVGTEGIISPDDARVQVMVVPANEEIIVARETVKVLGNRRPSRRPRSRTSKNDRR